MKLWPILLFPLIVRPFLRQPRRLISLTALFITATALLLAPQLYHAIQPEAGLNAYASDWRTHAFLFALLEDGLLSGLAEPGQVARLVVAAIISTLAGLLALRDAQDTARLPSLAAIIIASLLFLSPTGYPWYLIWLAPFLAFTPNVGLIALIVTAPLYWLRFTMGDDNPAYQWGIVPIAFGLPLALIAWSFYREEKQDAFRHHYSRA